MEAHVRYSSSTNTVVVSYSHYLLMTTALSLEKEKSQVAME
jgi:hypothetical protein